jgi:hypothetical protein
MGRLRIFPSNDTSTRSTHPDTFDRQLSDDFLNIVSTCEKCGEAFRGTARDGLPEREKAHARLCRVQRTAIDRERQDVIIESSKLIVDQAKEIIRKSRELIDNGSTSFAKKKPAKVALNKGGVLH